MAKTKSEIQAKYAKNNTITKSLQLNKTTDKDIIDYLNTLPNFQGEIKRLIRREIAELKLVEKVSDDEWTDDDYFDDGYTDGFDHPFDDELKVNNLL